MKIKMAKKKPAIRVKKKPNINNKIRVNKKSNIIKRKPIINNKNATINKPKKRIKIHYGRIIIALIIISLVLYIFNCLFKFPIKNIYIYNNTIYSDQQIIDMAGISDYPSIIGTKSITISRRLERDDYIKKATVTKRKLKEVHIDIEENYPLFYNSTNKKTILKDESKVKSSIPAPVLINYVPDTVYKEFVSKMAKIDRNIIDRMSEIKYDPNTVDDERFLITMNDGNYVYLTVLYFEKINNYVEILKNFENKKGILYLDSGEYFQVYE